MTKAAKHDPFYHANLLEGTMKVRCSCGWWIEAEDRDEATSQWRAHSLAAELPRAALDTIPTEAQREVSEQFERDFSNAQAPLNIVPLRQDTRSKNIAETLRRIADDIDNGKYDYAPQFAALVFGRETVTSDADGGETQKFRWSTHGLGETSFFRTQGLLSAALYRFEGDDIKSS